MTIKVKKGEWKMNCYYSDKKKMTKENKAIIKLQLDKERVYTFQDDMLKIETIVYGGRLSDKFETIRYQSINKLVDVNGAGLAIYGDIFDVLTGKTFSGPEAYRYISSCTINYEELVKALICVTGLTLETNIEKRKSEVSSARRGVARTMDVNPNAQYCIYTTGRVLIDELAKMWPVPISQMWVNALNDQKRRMTMYAYGCMKIDISGEDFVAVCGPRYSKYTIDAMAAVSPWRNVATNMDNNNFGKGSTWEYRIPMNEIEGLTLEVEKHTHKPADTTWWRIRGKFQVIEYEDLTSFLTGEGEYGHKMVQEILIEDPWFMGEEKGYEWQNRISKISGKKWGEIYQ